MFTRRYKKILICAALLLLIAAAVFSAASLSRKIDQDRQSLVENTIRNYAVQCYAPVSYTHLDVYKRQS